jgi:hypothetical protein
MRCKVEFIHWISGNIAYTTTESTSLVDFAFSAKKMASVSYFAMEPMRLKLTFIADEWIESALLAPGQALDRGISIYKIRFYIDDSLKFTGLIDLAGVSRNKANSKLEVTSYDMLKLYYIYSDLKRRYWPYYYTISDIFWMYNDDIRLRLGLNIGLSSDIQTPSTRITATNKVIYTCDFTGIVDRVLDIKNATQGDLDFLTQSIYFRNYNGLKLIYLAYRPKGKTSGGKVQGCHFFGKVWEVFNNLCLAPVESLAVDEYIDADGSSDWEYKVKEKFSIKYPQYYQGSVIPANDNLTIGSKSYSHSVAYGQLDYGFLNSPVPIEVYYSGPVSTTYRLNSGFSPYEDQAVLVQKDVLKQVMMVKRMALWCDNEGTLILTPKTSTGNTINVSSDDIVEMEESHIFPEKLHENSLNTLMGDTRALAEVVSEFHSQDISQTMLLDIVLAGDYEISLFDTLLFDGESSKVVEITPNPIKKEYKIKAWRLYA